MDATPVTKPFTRIVVGTKYYGYEMTDTADHISPKHISIVGCGFTGVSTFYQLVRSYPVKEITIFEASGRFGPGFPYAIDECADYLINNTTDTMCLAPDNRRAFLDWLENNPEVEADRTPKGHLPRNLFGIFLESVFAETCNRAIDAGISIRKIPFEVTSVEETESGVQLQWEKGALVADAVIMATGRCPGKSIVETLPQNMQATYISSHISCNAIDEAPIDATIHVLGASLSAYDVINRLFSEKTGCNFIRGANGALKYEPGANKRQMVLCSRSGRLKKMQSLAPGVINREAFTREALEKTSGALTLQEVASAIEVEAKTKNRKLPLDDIRSPYQDCQSDKDINERAGDILAADIEAAKKNGENFLVDLFENAQIEMWDGFSDQILSAEEERLYREKYETAVFAYSAPCPIPTAERLLALMRAGRLRIITGTQAPVLSDDNTVFDIPHRFGNERASFIIDAAGKVDRNINSVAQPDWVKELRDNGVLESYRRDGIEMAGADIDMKTFRPRGAKNIYFANMYLWGPGLFTSSAFIMATIVSRVLGVIFQKH